MQTEKNRNTLITRNHPYRNCNALRYVMLRDYANSIINFIQLKNKKYVFIFLMEVQRQRQGVNISQFCVNHEDQLASVCALNTPSCSRDGE